MTNIMQRLWDAPYANSETDELRTEIEFQRNAHSMAQQALAEQASAMGSRITFLVSQLQSAMRALDEIKWLRPLGGTPTKYQERVEVIAEKSIGVIKAALTDTEYQEQYRQGKCGECMTPTISQVLVGTAINNNREYEELRAIIDNGSESMTHEDAVKELKRLMEEEAK